MVTNETLKLAEKIMQTDGFANPKVVLFYRDNDQDIQSIMIDLAPQKYFDDRMHIMEQVGSYLKKENIPNIDLVVYFGEANLTIDSQMKHIVMATGINDKGETMTLAKEIQRYILPEHPEKSMFNLIPTELIGLKYQSPVLKTLMDNFKK